MVLDICRNCDETYNGLYVITGCRNVGETDASWVCLQSSLLLATIHIPGKKGIAQGNSRICGTYLMGERNCLVSSRCKLCGLFLSENIFSLSGTLNTQFNLRVNGNYNTTIYMLVC